MPGAGSLKVADSRDGWRPCYAKMSSACLFMTGPAKPHPADHIITHFQSTKWSRIHTGAAAHLTQLGPSIVETATKPAGPRSYGHLLCGC